MKRGEVWTVSASGFAGKPRPAVIVQNDAFNATASVTICVVTTDETDAPLFRLLMEPSETNGLRESSRLMVDKVVTVGRDKLGRQIGRLDDEDIARLDRALMVFLGLA
jgi:mRNA interferase MazF